MRAVDVFVLLKIVAIENSTWTPFELSLELEHTPEEIEESVKRLLKAGLLRSSWRPDPEALKRFLLLDLHQKFPTTPGKLTRGVLTGAKPGNYFAMNLPYASIWVWPQDNGPHVGYEIEPLSPHCCFAALNDKKLRNLLAITETLRVAGHEARIWAEVSLRQNGLF